MRSHLLVFVFLVSGFSLQAQNADIRILRSLNGPVNPAPDVIMRGFSASVTPMIFVAPLVRYGIPYCKKDSALFPSPFYYAGGLALAGAVTTGLKYIVNRDRPFVTYPDIIKKGYAGSKSFPSGHTSSAFATATLLTLSTHKWYVAVPAYAWACSVGYSRMYLGVHYPTDVLAGAVLGTGLSWLGYKITEHCFQRYAEKQAQRHAYRTPYGTSFP